MPRRKTVAKRRPNKSSRRPSSRRSSKRPKLLIRWPYLFLILLCAGAFLAGWTWLANADNITVSAVIDAPPLTQPAIITTPADGTHFSASPILISGSCPLDSYVEIYRDGIFAGTGLCSAQQTFQIDVALMTGASSIRARVFNITDTEGPSSSPITLYLDTLNIPPAPTPSGGSTPSGSSGSGSGPAAAPVQPLILNTASDFRYTGYLVGSKLQIKLTTGGGVPPYKISIDWGDTDPAITRNAPGPFTVDHTYSKTGPHTKNSYIIRITETDSRGDKTILQMFVVLYSKTNAPAAVIITSPPSSPISSISNSTRWLWVAWPSYLVVFVMIFCFWLGEREEMVLLRRKNKLRKRHS